MSSDVNWERIPAPKPKEEDNLLVDLVELLQSIDTGTPIASLNQTTIADNNGRRIQL